MLAPQSENCGSSRGPDGPLNRGLAPRGGTCKTNLMTTGWDFQMTTWPVPSLPDLEGGDDLDLDLEADEPVIRSAPAPKTPKGGAKAPTMAAARQSQPHPSRSSRLR